MSVSDKEQAEVSDSPAFNPDDTIIALVTADWVSNPVDAKISFQNTAAEELIEVSSDLVVEFFNQLEFCGDYQGQTGAELLELLAESGELAVNCLLGEKPLFLYAKAKGKVMQFTILDAYLLTKEKAPVSDYALLSLGRQTASIVHDMQEPLVLLDYQTELILQSKQDISVEKYKATFGLFRNAIDHVKELVGSILTSAGGKDGGFDEVAVNTFLHQWYELEAHKPSANDIVLNILPCQGSVMIQQMSVKRVLTNLLKNAVDAMRAAGQDKVVISVKAEEYDASQIAIIVEDNGPGADEAIVPKLFSYGTSNKSEGYGIGLYGCRLLVERHGGKIWYERKDDKTRFVFTLPKA